MSETLSLPISATVQTTVEEIEVKTGETFNITGGDVVIDTETFKVDATDDIVYINAPDLTGLVSGDDLGFYAGGRGDLVTLLQLID